MERQVARRNDAAVIVLAAGHGRRLGSAGGEGPKWLIEVAGAPIAARHLDAIEEALGTSTHVTVVVGHAAERVEAYCNSATRRTALRPTLARHPLYAARNNWYSLLVGLDAVERSISNTDVVVIINSDLFAPAQWVGQFLESAVGMAGVAGAIAVDTRRSLTDEAMKVAAGPPDLSGRRWCTSIGKVGVPEPIGEYVGMTALAVDGRARVSEALRRFERDETKRDAWYEGAFNELSAATPFLSLWETPSSTWVEIDDRDDLLAAERLAAS